MRETLYREQVFQLPQNRTQGKRLLIPETRQHPRNEEVQKCQKDSSNSKSYDMHTHSRHGPRREGEAYGRIHFGCRFLDEWPTSTFESLIISSVLVANLGNKSITLSIPITCKTTTENKTVDTQILLDTGAGGLFMNTDYANKHDFLLYPLDKPIIPRNIDNASLSPTQDHKILSLDFPGSKRTTQR